MRNISAFWQHLFESPFDTLHGFTHNLKLPLLIGSMVGAGYHLERIAHMMVHQLDGVEFLNQRPSATLFIEEDHHADENGDQQIVDCDHLGVKAAVLQYTVEQPAQGVDQES